MSDSTTEKGFLKKLKKNKVFEILLIAVLAIVALVVIYNAFFAEKKEKNGNTVNASDYVAELETKLSGILSQIKGAGKVSVMITVDSGGQTVLATEEVVNRDGSVTTSPILVGGNTVVLQELYPAITGVLIVAEGAAQLSVKVSLLDAAASVLAVERNIIVIYPK